jgi:hypothetical protein
VSRRDAILVTLLALVAAVILTWPLALHPSARLAAPEGPGDPFLNYWILGWDLGTIANDPAALFTGRVFDANIFHPADRTLAYSDHLILQAVSLAPLYLATRDVALCYNALLFFSLAAGMLAMYVFARAVTGSRAGAMLAGIAWGFMPFRFAHLLHVQLQSLYWLPLAFLFLHRVIAGRRRRDAVLLGVFAALQAISSLYWGVVGALALVVAAAVLAVAVGRWRSVLVARRLVLAGVVGAVMVAPFAWPYWQLQRREGFARNLYEASQHEARVASYARVPPDNLLYGRTGLLRPQAPAGGGSVRGEGHEQELFPGFVLIGFAIAGVWFGWRRDSRPVVAAMLAVVGLGFALSLGPDGCRWLYSLAHRFVFGFQAVRAPARFGALVSFGLAVLAAVGMRELLSRSLRPEPHRAAAWWPVIVLAAACSEYVSIPLPTVDAPPKVTAVGQWLARQPGPGAVLSLPLDVDRGNAAAMLQSLEHRRPLVNGYSGQRPAFFMALVDTLNQLPSAEALWTLRDLHVRFVVSPRPLAVVPDGPLVERARLGGDVVYETLWTTETEAAVPRPEAAPPPDPGPMPFDAAETLTYRLLWQNGASMGVAAGRATLTARAVHGPGDVPGARWQLAVEVETAPWVSRFFEAHDRIDTWADDRLLPMRQLQRLREGRRAVDRETRFDPVTRTQTTGEGPPLPWPPGARDGLTALYYARTLALLPGAAPAFPVVEGGRRFSAACRVEAVEFLELNGRRFETFRMTSRLDANRDRRRPVRATLWITTDRRRVPVVIEVETEFGAFRAELDGERDR